MVTMPAAGTTRLGQVEETSFPASTLRSGRPRGRSRGSSRSGDLAGRRWPTRRLSSPRPLRISCASTPRRRARASSAEGAAGETGSFARPRSVPMLEQKPRQNHPNLRSEACRDADTPHRPAPCRLFDGEGAFHAGFAVARDRAVEGVFARFQVDDRRVGAFGDQFGLADRLAAGVFDRDVVGEGLRVGEVRSSPCRPWRWRCRWCRRGRCGAASISSDGGAAGRCRLRPFAAAGLGLAFGGFGAGAWSSRLTSCRRRRARTRRGARANATATFFMAESFPGGLADFG